MDVQAYLDRVGFEGSPRADLATLRALHRGHALSISYENLDVQLGRTTTPDPLAAFDKIVRRRRGGWCYEMNGVLGAVLDEIGFKVTRLAGGVARKVRGNDAIGNHLVLLVEMDDGPWIADVGFGDGSRDPFPLREGPIVSDGYVYQLGKVDADWWRLTNHPLGGAPNFDFRLEPADPAHLAAKCRELQTSPTSIFVMTAIVQRHMGDEIRLLRGRAFRRLRQDVQENTTIDSADDFARLLKGEFELDVPEAATIWPGIVARHDTLFPPVSAGT